MGSVGSSVAWVPNTFMTYKSRSIQPYSNDGLTPRSLTSYRFRASYICSNSISMFVSAIV
eukprot:1214483-Amorphochlora_amoeboformis.AAC.1